jgi:hypothetical protein
MGRKVLLCRAKQLFNHRCSTERAGPLYRGPDGVMRAKRCSRFHSISPPDALVIRVQFIEKLFSVAVIARVYISLAHCKCSQQRVRLRSART